jgi:hypothetical protein
LYGKEKFEDTKGVIRICKLKDGQWPQDTKGVIRIRKIEGNSS